MASAQWVFLRTGQFKTARRAGLYLLLLGVALGGCAESQDGSGGAGSREQPPAPVSAETVGTEAVAVTREYPGRTRGARVVDVRARVNGVLEERVYDEGQRVAAGDVLFRIDPDRYRIAVRQAEAQLQNARAELNQAQREWSRVSRLYDDNAVSERERDNARSALELARATVALAEARLADAELSLSYTQVKAPVDGVSKLEALSEGSLIGQGDLLTTIVQQDPIHLHFALPEDDAAIQQAARRALSGNEEGASRKTHLILPDGSRYAHAGTVDFTDSSIDPSTGSVTARAVFPNPDGVITPGQFLRVRITLQRLDDVILVPERAVGQGEEGPQLFVVDEENVAHARPVELGPLVDGRRAILDGLADGDRVIVDGLVGVREGASVKVSADDDQGGGDA